MIEVHNLAFRYSTRRNQVGLLRDVALTLEPGLTLLVGPNGCGKSTLMRLLAGIERPMRGQIRVEGHDLWREEVLARRGLVYLPEDPDITPYASVREILRLVGRLRFSDGRLLPDQEPAETVEDLVELMIERLGLGGLEERNIVRLSQGQRRRVLLAAAMLGEAPNLLLDEPLEALDVETKALLLEWLEKRLEGGASALVISHTLEPFVPMATRLATVREGSWLEWPTPTIDDVMAVAVRLARGLLPE